MNFKRYAIYYIPSNDLLYKLGSSWLGWDTILGQPASQPEINSTINIKKITENINDQILKSPLLIKGQSPINKKTIKNNIPKLLTELFDFI